MTKTTKLGMLLMVISLAFACNGEDDFYYCESTVKKWAEASSHSAIKENKLTLKDLLFFLHIPRTGGRTYYNCFLKNLYAKTDECPRSYDKLRFDPREPKCRLFVTHDDYSLMSKLPKDRTSAVTILRNPIDRIFSTYEFVVEVAARFLVHPNLTSASQKPKNMGSDVISTLDIWPWKHLVPWMREDLFTRREARKHTQVRSMERFQSPYDVKEFIMPLNDFLDDPIAHEIIHNGATFQIAGLTNISFLKESSKIRRCIRSYPNLGHYVLKVAKGRLDQMLYIGLTEDHKVSATIFAGMVGSQVISQSEALNSLQEVASNETGSRFLQRYENSREIQDEMVTGGKKTSEDATSSHAGTTDKNMTAEKLMTAYEACTSKLRKAQADRRTSSLKMISAAKFSKKTRDQVSQTITRKILLMNSLDVDLYEHARHLFMEQSKRLITRNDQRNSEPLHIHLPSEHIIGRTHYDITWKDLWLISIIFLFFIFISFIASKRKKYSKIKV